MGMIGYLKRIDPQRLAALIEGKEELYDYIHGEDGAELDLDKAWHGLHYLLCGDPWGGEAPLSEALMGGKPLNEEEQEDIIVRYLTPEQVREVSDTLEATEPQTLANNFDPDDMNDAPVYPASDWNDEGELDYLMGYYQPMRDHYRAAAEAGEAMLIYVA